MKKIFFTIVCSILCLFSYAQENKKVMYVTVQGENVNESIRSIVEDVFQKELKKNYDVRSHQGKGLFSEEVINELRFQEKGGVIDGVAQYELLKADFLCVVFIDEVKFGDNIEYYLRSKILDMKNSIVVHTANCPEINDKEIKKISSIKELQIASSILVARLSENKKLETDVINTRDKLNNDRRGDKRKTNARAMGASLIPGVGLILKAHNVEGSTYLIGDIALLGAGTGFHIYKNGQKSILQDRSTTDKQYQIAKRNYDNAKIASYSCFGAAAALYVVNLIRSYVAEPRTGAKLKWAVVPSVSSSMCYNNDLSINLALTYNF